MARILILITGLGLAGCTPIEVAERYEIGRHVQSEGYDFKVCRPVIGQLKNSVRKLCGGVLSQMKWHPAGECLIYPNYLAKGPPYLSLCFDPSSKLAKIYPLRRPPKPKTFAPYDACGPGDTCGPDMDCAGEGAGLKFCAPKCRSDADCSKGACQLNLSQSGNPDHCVLTCKKSQIGQRGCMTNGVCASIGEKADLGFCVHPDAVQQ